MSKYHELRAAFAEGDLTADSVAAGLRDVLEINGYGTAFQVFRGGVPVDEEAARRAIVDEVAAAEGYRRSLQRMMREPRWQDWSAFVEADPAGGLAFEHGDPAQSGFRRSLELGGLEVVVGPEKIERRLKRRTKREKEGGEKAERLRGKLGDTRNTTEADYLAHAECCGYLVRNTTVRFNSSGKKQWGTSVVTRIGGIALPALRGFIDSAGRATLSAVSTHADRQLSEYADDAGGAKAGIEAMHREFANDIVDFLNLESEVDIDGVARLYRPSGPRRHSDSKFQSIEDWGGDRGTVLGKLKERRVDLDPEKITAAFDKGYGPGPAA